MIHELGHTLGQSRPDRDQYVEILWENITSEWHNQFDKQSEVNSRNVPYDYKSIMHYGQYVSILSVLWYFI